MYIANFIKNKFIEKNIYIFYGFDAETITYDQSWASNKEFLFGKVIDVIDNVLILSIENNSKIYINCDKIVSFWEPGFNYNDAIKTSLTKRVSGSKIKL